MATKKDEPSLTQQKMPSKKEEQSLAQQKMPSKKEEPSPAQQKMPSKKDEMSQAQQKMPTKKEEPSQAQQKMPSKKEEPCQAQQKMPGKKEEPSQAQQKMPSKKEEPSQAQQKMPSKKDESSQAQQKMPSKKDESSQAQQKMSSKKEEPSQAQQKMEDQSQAQQGDAATTAAAAAPPSPGGPPGPPDHLNSCAGSGNSVLKSGPLFLSSKGIGWTSWKKRWFILTHTSLVFFRSDPNAISQKGNEVNLTLGGIDLNNSGSVVVKADKKLITVQFHDGRDGRTFTLKAETLEDLYEWKAALEKALSQAPSSAHAVGQNGIFGNDQADAVDGSKEPVNDKQPVRSTVLHRPILLALEDVDGAPTFLEKALRFVEEYGVKVEGILRQAADVEDVKRRIREYEQGKTEFSSEEDPHVIADCVKYVIRELPSSPVPASCCNALLEACRTEHSARVNAMRVAILDTFPEPNRRLLQRILMMMQTVASHKSENLMSSSAVAACMAPLLLRPLLAGDCEIENDFDVGGDGSMQLLQAAAAANHAQAIVITLLEEYDKILGEGFVSSDLYSDTEESGSESEEATDDDESYDDDEDYEDDECDDETQGSDAYNDDDDDYEESGTGSESAHSVNNDLDDDKDSDDLGSGSKSSESGDDIKATKNFSSSLHSSPSLNDDSEKSEDSQTSKSSATDTNKSAELSKGVQGVTKLEDTLTCHNLMSCIPKSPSTGNGPGHNARHGGVWGRSAASKKLSMDSIDFPYEEEAEIELLEAEKSDLQKRLTEEIEGNAILEASLEKRKKTLHERRLALEKEVARLEEELQRERDKRIALEAALNLSQGPIPAKIDEKIKADLKDVAQAEADIINSNKKVEDLGIQINQQLEQKSASMNDSCNQREPNHQAKMKDKPKGTEAAFERSGSKETFVDEAECEKGKKQESSLANKQSPQNQQFDDSIHNSKPTTAAEKVSRKSLASSNSKKSATKGERANSTTSAITKLTTRFNFMKERRSQIANEFLGMEKGRGSSQAVPSPSDKSKVPEPMQSVQNPEKGSRGPDISQ